MSSTRFNSAPARLLALAALAAAAQAQSAYLTIAAPSGYVTVGAQMTLAASIVDLAGTPIDASGISWQSSDATIASVSNAGVAQGLLPGDVTLTAADSNTGASASQLVHVVPGLLTLQASPATFHVGESAKLSASALDASGNPIAGVTFQFRSGEPSVASVAPDGSLTGVAEGFATIEARIVSASTAAALVSTATVRVMPKPAYKIERLLSTDAAASTTIAAYSNVSAGSANEIGSIVTLANGNQAAMLIENGKARALAMVGQVLPNAGRLVMHIDAISVNSHGDAALLIQYPAQWCNASVILFPHGKPEVELGAAGCYNGLYQRSLSDDGSVLYRNNDQVIHVSPAGVSTLLFSLATQPKMADPVRGVNDFTPSGAGTFVLNTYLMSGSNVYFYFDGKALTKVYQSGDGVGGRGSNGIDNVTAGADGKFYARANGPNYSALVQLAPGALQRLTGTGDTFSGGTVGWIQRVADAGANGVLMLTDLQESTYHTSLVIWNGAILEYAPAAGWNSMLGGAMLPDGTALASVVLAGDSTPPGLRAFTGPGAASVTMAYGAAFPSPAPAGIAWHYAARGAGATALPVRAAGEAIVTAGAAMLAAIGASLPNGQTATQIGGAMANQAGDVVFTAGFTAGSGIFRYRAGQLTTLADTLATRTGPPGRLLNWANTYQGRYIAMNDRGDVAIAANYALGNASENDLALYDAAGAHLVAQQSATAPGGGSFSGFNMVAVDDTGRVLFVAPTSDGHTAAYFWDGSALSRVIGTGDAGPAGLTVNEVSNVSGGANGFTIMLAFGGYQMRELRWFDGSHMTPLLSSATSLLDDAGLNYFWSNEATLDANGDVHAMALTSDNLPGVYAHRGDGRDYIVARPRDALPDGASMIMPLSISSAAGGIVYFTADVLLNGVEVLALYRATPL